MSDKHKKYAGEVAGAAQQRVNDLLNRMRLEEKVGQMVQKPIELAEDADQGWVRQGRVGSIIGANDPAQWNEIQRISVEESRLGIPLFSANDVIHGYRTIFPIPLAESCTWDPELVEEASRVAALEASAVGTDMILAPMVDVARDPRWGRIAETCGEDQYLGREMAKARVRGFQSRGLPDGRRMTSCPKHFVAYGACEAGRDYNTVDVSERRLREVHLPPFEGALGEGAGCVMTAFNEINGVPATANAFTLRGILREELGCTCVTISDYNSIGELVPHGVAVDPREAARKAIEAGVDIDMGSTAYPDHLQDLVETGQVDEKLVDGAVRRILTLKMELGLFESPYVDEELQERVILSESHRELARKVARRSMVLLQNENDVLPLDGEDLDIAVVGPLADERAEMIGTFAHQGREEDCGPSVYGALKELTGEDVDLTYMRGCGIEDGDEKGLEDAADAAESADVVIMVLGETVDMNGEASCLTDLGLAGRQQELLDDVAATDTPVVTVIATGRPLVLREVADRSDAILQAWHGGYEAGRATAEILLGRVNPSGKLTTSFPRSEGQIPLYYAQKNTGRPATGEGTKQFEEPFKSRYLDCPNSPFYPFGYGMSYTDFDYSDLAVETPEISTEGTLIVTVAVTNNGDRAGEEVVQLYVRDLVGSVTRPVRELKGFQRIALDAGKKRCVRFQIPAQELGLYDQNMHYVVEPGEFKVWVGPNSAEGLEGGFRIADAG